jgi:hypothetical protein
MKPESSGELTVDIGQTVLSLTLSYKVFPRFGLVALFRDRVLPLPSQPILDDATDDEFLFSILRNDRTIF